MSLPFLKKAICKNVRFIELKATVARNRESGINHVTCSVRRSVPWRLGSPPGGCRQLRDGSEVGAR